MPYESISINATGCMRGRGHADKCDAEISIRFRGFAGNFVVATNCENWDAAMTAAKPYEDQLCSYVEHCIKLWVEEKGFKKAKP